MSEGILPRVLYVEPTGGIGGSGMSLLALAGGLDRYAASVVIPSEGRLARRLRDARIPVHVLRLHQGSRRFPVRWGISVIKLAILCRRSGARLIHANHEFVNRLAWPAARLAGVPYICHVRNIQTAGSFRDCWLGLPQILVANSQATAQSFAHIRRNGQRCLVIYNGVDLRQFDGRRETALAGSDEFVVAQVGRVAPEKGVHLFVKAVADVASRYPFVRAVVAGDASVCGNEAYLSDVRQLALHHGLGGKLDFLGHVENVRDLYASADVLVQPSDAEPFGRTLIEAMAMRLPVIATAAGGPGEIIENEVSGLLVPPNDPRALSGGIERTIKDKAFADRLAENGRRTVEERFSLKSHVIQVQALYDDMLARRRW